MPTAEARVLLTPLARADTLFRAPIPMDMPPHPPHLRHASDWVRPSLPPISNDDGFRGLFAFSGWPNPFQDALSPSTASCSMSIRGAANGTSAPPPLPPPRLIPTDGPINPVLQCKPYLPRCEVDGASSHAQDRRLSLPRRGTSFRHDISDEDSPNHDTRSPIEFQASFRLHSIKNYRPNGDAIDRSMVSKLDGRRCGENWSPPRHSRVSSPACDRPRTTRAEHSQLAKLSLPHRAKVIDSAYGYTHSPLVMSAASTQDSDDLVRDNEPDVPVEETLRTRTLNMDDAWREREREREHVHPAAGQKRRASSPLGEDRPLDMFRRRDGSMVCRGSPTQRLQVNPQGLLSSVSSLRSGSCASNLTASSMTSANSSGRRSPNAQSPGALSPTDTVGSPFAPSMSVTTSPRGSMCRSAVVAQTGHPRPLTMDTRGLVSSPRFAEYAKPINGNNRGGGVAKLKDTFMCQCCPKKPKKFDTEEELDIHAAEKQYECHFCGSRFKNKNEAERHQNSLHVRRYSWSCSALTGYERAFHDSTTRPGEADACGYCGEEFARTGAATGPTHGVRFIADLDWEERIRHLQEKHKFRECNSSKKFYRADHFRQHLKHSHSGTSGKWTNMLENACMVEEEQE